MNFIFISIILLIPFAEAASEKDEVKSLYGLSWKPTFKHYSGYLAAGENKFLHYWFVESQRGKGDPVVLWLNGGPGCSSMDGFLSEHGPFLVSPDGHNLTANKYSWNLIAHVLYIESPVGVGFSYASDQRYSTSDDIVSLQNHKAIQSFFSLFPEYKTNEFFATGESYGGIYIPTLSVRLSQDPDINFKGFAIGNGLTDYTYNLNSMIYFAYNHALIGEKLWLAAVSMCCKDGNSTIGNCDFSVQKCSGYVEKIFDVIDSLNIYSLYAKCYYNNDNNNNNNNNRNNNNNNNNNNHVNITNIKKNNRDFITNRYFGYVNEQLMNKDPVSIPCIDARAITTYLNVKQVRTDLHIPAHVSQWSICTNLDYKKVYQDVRQQFSSLLSAGHRALVYNGDTDMACNFLGDQWFVESLGLKTLHDRTEWFYIDPEDNTKQVAGFVKQFRNLTFATIKGAGHMVPQDKPLQSIYMFKNFLDGNF